MNVIKALESYTNGNISQVKAYLINSPLSLGEFLEFYIQEYSPSNEEIVRFVKRLEKA